jgi:hypothetical protein
MNFYSFVLYTHVVATLGLFAGLGIEWLILVAMSRAPDAREARAWIEYWPQVMRVMVVSVVLLVVTGVSLASRLSLWNLGWIKVSAASLAILAPLSAFGARKMRGLRKQTSQGLTVQPGGLPAMGLALSSRTALALGIVMLMTAKTNLVESAAIVCIAGIAGLVLGVAVVNRRTVRPVYEAGR